MFQMQYVALYDDLCKMDAHSFFRAPKKGEVGVYTDYTPEN